MHKKLQTLSLTVADTGEGEKRKGVINPSAKELSIVIIVFFK